MDPLAIVITGARGRLGQALEKHFRNLGHSVRAYSRSPGPEHLNLRDLPRDLAGGQIRTILHLAWSVVPAEAERDPEGQWRSDLPQLESLLQELVKKKPLGSAPPRLVFFSSGSVYGETVAGRPPFEETDQPNPKGLYARAKVAAETMILDCLGQGLEATILRVTNVYGFPQEAGRPQGVIPALFYAAAQKSPFSMWGDGSAVKDYLYIEDVCTAVERVLQKNLSGVFNLASGHSVALHEVAALVQEVVGLPIEVRLSAPPIWDVQHGRYSCRRLREATGWAPNFSLPEGLLRFWNDWRALSGLSK